MFIHFLAGPTHQPQILFSFAVLSFFFPLPSASWDAAFFAFPGLQQRWQDDRAGDAGVSCVCVSWTVRISSGGNVITTGYNGIQWMFFSCLHIYAYFSLFFNVLALSPWPVLGLSVVSAAVEGLSSLVVHSSGTGWHYHQTSSSTLSRKWIKDDSVGWNWSRIEYEPIFWIKEWKTWIREVAQSLLSTSFNTFFPSRWMMLNVHALAKQITSTGLDHFEVHLDPFSTHTAVRWTSLSLCMAQRDAGL